MATPQDCQISAAAEAVAYRTYAAPTRSYEFNDESLQWMKDAKQGTGLRVSSRLPRSGRRFITKGSGGGDLTMDFASKGLGPLLQAALGGAVTPTQIATSGAYVQIHTLGDVPPSLTIQKTTPQVDGSTLTTNTFLGCMVDTMDIDSPNGEIVTVKFGLDIGDINTAQAYVNVASAPYAGGTLFHFGQATARIGGTITAAVTSTVASSTGATTIGVRNLSLSLNNDLAKDRYNYNGTVSGQARKAKPVVGNRALTGKFTAEFDNTTLRDAYLADTDLAILLDFQGEAITTSFARLQLVIPVARLDSDALPKSNGGDLITQDFEFTVLETTPGTAPFQLVYVSSDTTL